jgi:hypothetical protein
MGTPRKLNVNPKVNDKVRVLRYAKTSPNGYARVTEVNRGYIKVSNLNMPFQGTLANKVLFIGEFE